MLRILHGTNYDFIKPWRIAIGITVAFIATGLIFLGVHYSTPGSAENASGPYLNNDSFYRQPKHVPFDAQERRAVRKVLAHFISTAVSRCHVGESWDLAGPSLVKAAIG